MLTRRELIRLGLLGGAAAALPLERLAALASDSDHDSPGYAFGGNSPGSPPVVPFQALLPIPPVLQPVSSDATTDFYEVVMREAQAEILPGRLTPIWGYNGLYPGPTIRARQGRRAVVRQINQVPEDTAVHLHGAKVAPEHDGHPVHRIPPGTFRDFDYPNQQLGLTMWYHDHVIHKTAPHLYRGLAAFYLLEGEDEAALNLPSGPYDIPVLIQDRLFNADGSLSYPGPVHGFYGDTIVVNGKAQPRLEVARRKYRIRLLNGSNHREYLLAFSPRVPASQIASDGGLLPAPVPRSSIFMLPAERVELVVDFSAVPLGSRVELQNLLGDAKTTQIMRFDVTRDEADPSQLPAALRPLPAFGTPVRTRLFDLAFDQARQEWLINGKGFDPERIDAVPRLDSTEIWQFTNRSDQFHPIHLHLVQFRILDRAGRPPQAFEAGLKDTVSVGPFETMRILVKFSGFTGPYVYHCHRLEHED
ncbi:MAG: multicopper oxidase family protein, partial [Acidimicrobiales bacterium]